MHIPDFKNPGNYLIAGLVAFFSLAALWLRLIPMLNMGSTDLLDMVAMDDPMYNLRQVELILANFPGYGWFEPMTNYPYGTSIYWGPLFPTIIAVCCLIAGAVTRPEIIGIGLLIPPLMGAVIVILMYFIGRAFGDWKTGLLASGFTAIVSGQFFTISWYGYVDHHIAEVLFSTLFCLIYSYAIIAEKDGKIDLKNIGSYKNILFLAFLAGVSYLLGLFVMPTMILFALIVGIFTIVQFIIDVYRNRTSEYLLVVNVTVFAIAIFGLLLFGLKNPGMALSTYSIGHVYAYLGLIGGTVLLYGTAWYLRGREKFWYPAVLLVSAVCFSGILFFAAPQIYELLISSLLAFFGQQPVTETVLEAMGWSLDRAWLSFNYGIILFAGGIMVMLYNNAKDEHPGEVFALVWSLVMLLSTWQHIRYEYYLAINIALMSAVCSGFVFGRFRADVYPRISGRGEIPLLPEETEKQNTRPSKGKQRKKGTVKVKTLPAATYLLAILTVLCAGTGILFVYSSASYSYTNAMHNPFNLNSDWRESLEWLGNNSPEPGLDYLAIYDADTFTYPETAYGVMSWWDYGHMITYISKRIPNANPFQQGVSGDNGAAAYFITPSEDTANGILDRLGTRYVVTDIEMDFLKFPAMATWYNASRVADPYMMSLLVPGETNPDTAELRVFNTQEYYLTMISRLHNFDGSMIPVTETLYIEYADPGVTGLSLPAIVNGGTMNVTEAEGRVAQYNLKSGKNGYHALTLSTSLVTPVSDVPALRHYRLIHESPTNVFNEKTPDVKYVKVFEYVKGARITGSGIIELDLVSNTGRNFTYRQESIDGEFIVPYTTTGNPNGVKATGRYRITGSSQEFDVPEAAVISGSTIN
ncbi:MAG: oligosaccharyl transferase, archaeosortase A system-associated [Methanoregula sp.]|nr:oligosaccharyl transferase, archaeosortase A system-associated [Methanoregula sp.]